jgi:hypothetical protein
MIRWQDRIARALLWLVLVFPGRAVVGAEPYESYYRFLGNYPDEDKPVYHKECQGITHDDQFWYITNKWTIWKFHVTDDLRDDSERDLKQLSSVGDLAGYEHLGDPSYYYYKDGNQGYLLVPVEDVDRELTPVLAVFRSNDLGYVGKAVLNGHSDAACCAVDPKGIVYIPDGGTIGGIREYRLNWGLLHTNKVELQSLPDFYFYDELTDPLWLKDMQGAVISESGERMYVVCGNAYDVDASYGIHVFDMRTQMRVARSNRSSLPFKYEWHPGSTRYEEPEGITIWELDDKGAPGISGQLHVLLLDNEASDNDDVYLMHYTGTIYVNGKYVGSEDGTIDEPYTRIAQAISYYGTYSFWMGARIKIQAGSYPEPCTFSKPVQVLSRGGTATFGSNGRVSLYGSAAINVSDEGMLIVH